MKKKIVFIAPHLSTGGMPQYLVRQIELIKDEHEVYCIEWDNVTGGVLVVQRNKVVNLLGDRLITFGENKHELFTLIERIKPDIIHLQEIPELFMQKDVADKLYSMDREYVIIETSHDSGYDTNDKIYLPDKFLMVSRFQASLYDRFNIPCDIVEYPIENKIRTKSREQALTELGLDPNLKHVINVGLFTPRKNQAEVIEYARMLQNYPIQFHFLGNQADNFKFYWEPLMQHFPPNCKWWNERSDVDTFYEAADLFLFTSQGSSTDHETMPLVIREALGWKVPSLIYNLPVYMGYFDQYNTIEYLDKDLQKNAYRIAEKLSHDYESPHKLVLHTVDGEKEFLNVEYRDSVVDNIVEYGEAAAQYFATFKVKELEYASVSLDRGDVFVDLGANIGMTALYALSKGASEIHCFEPDPKMIDLIKKNVPNVITHQHAVSSKNETLELYHWPYNPSSPGPKYNCETITLKEVIKRVGKKINFLKIDIEGFENEVFDSVSREDMRQVDKMMIEVHDINKMQEIHNKIHNLGFDVVFTMYGSGQHFVYAKYNSSNDTHHLTNITKVGYTSKEPINPTPMNNDLQELLKEKRLSFHNSQGGVNGLDGLYTMIQEYFKPHFKMVEIGSFEGKSTELFALNCAEVHAIDPYEAYDELSYEQLSFAETNFNKMRERRTNVKHIKQKSLDAVDYFDDESLDAVYIDGAHDYVNVKADILAWLPKVKPGGVICGHDYSGVVPGFGVPDINQAVTEVFPNTVPHTYNDSSWLIRKEEKQLKEIFIISCFPNTKEKEHLLNQTVSLLKELGKDVLLASHYPIPQYIVEKANFYIYDAYNMIDKENHTLDTDGPDFWVQTDNFYMESIITYHASALSRMFGIALDFVENLGYEFFTVIESDSIYDKNDLKRLDKFKLEMVKDNKDFLFFSPKFSEFAWQGERVYETYCYAGFVKPFQNTFKWPKTFDGWTALIKENRYNNCMEYLLKQKFKHLEHKALIKGTLKSEMLNSKVDLQTVGECSGVFYNENNPNEPVLFLYNHDSLGRDSSYEVNVDMHRFTINLAHNGWWYTSLNFQGDTITVKINTIREGKSYSETVTTISKDKLQELRKFKRMRFV